MRRELTRIRNAHIEGQGKLRDHGTFFADGGGDLEILRRPNVRWRDGAAAVGKSPAGQRIVTATAEVPGVVEGKQVEGSSTACRKQPAGVVCSQHPSALQRPVAMSATMRCRPKSLPHERGFSLSPTEMRLVVPTSDSLTIFAKLRSMLRSLTTRVFEFWIHRGAPLGSSDQEGFQP